jgi:hypothetical protein
MDACAGFVLGHVFADFIQDRTKQCYVSASNIAEVSPEAKNSYAGERASGFTYVRVRSSVGLHCAGAYS